MSRYVAGFLAQGLELEEAVFAIAMPKNREAILSHLPADILSARNRLHLNAFDADYMLSAFLVEDRPEKTKFFSRMDQIFSKPLQRGQRIRVYGEMVVRLWLDGRLEAALQLEELWNGLAERYEFELLCAYPLTLFEDRNSQWFLDTCAAHTNISTTS